MFFIINILYLFIFSIVPNKRFVFVLTKLPIWYILNINRFIFA